MKKSSSNLRITPIISILVVLLLSYQVESAMAHSPASVSLSYSKESSMLTVSITHTVEDRTTHYISEIQIFVNNTLVNTTTYTSQPTNSQFSYNFTITAGAGAVIKSIVKCNVAGQTTKELTVSTEDESRTPTPQDPSSPENQQQIAGFSMIIPLISVSLVFAVKKIAKKTDF